MVRPSRVSVFQWNKLTDQERDKIEVQELSKKVQDLVDNQPKLFQPITFVLPSWFNDKKQLEINQVTTEDKRNWLEARIKYLTATINLNHQKCWGYQKGADYCKRENNEIAERGKLQHELNNLGIRETSFNIFDPIPEAFAEEQLLSNDITQIINDIESGIIVIPAWFKNNIEWVKTGHITQQEFRTAYNYLVDKQMPTPEPIPIITELISDNMITQQIDYFTIENGRAIGQITFTATPNFNPFYYNKTITNIIQFKDRNGANILPTVKQNNLRFTQTERTETIQYDEGMNDNIYSKVSSFVWSSATRPTAFSKPSEFEIREKEPVKPVSSGFMAAGVAGAIAGLVLLGFIADHRGG